MIADASAAGEEHQTYLCFGDENHFPCAIIATESSSHAAPGAAKEAATSLSKTPGSSFKKGRGRGSCEEKGPPRQLRMSLHYPQGYRYRSASKAGGGEQGSDSDVAELSDLEDDEDEDGAGEATIRGMVVEENEDDEDDEDDDEDEEEEEEEGEELPYPGFVPIALRYLDQTTRPRNWCLALITNPYPFVTSRIRRYTPFGGL